MIALLSARCSGIVTTGLRRNARANTRAMQRLPKFTKFEYGSDIPRLYARIRVCFIQPRQLKLHTNSQCSFISSIEPCCTHAHSPVLCFTKKPKVHPDINANAQSKTPPITDFPHMQRFIRIKYLPDTSHSKPSTKSTISLASSAFYLSLSTHFQLRFTIL
jgi:hypothetical protein